MMNTRISSKHDNLHRNDANCALKSSRIVNYTCKIHVSHLNRTNKVGFCYVSLYSSIIG